MLPMGGTKGAMLALVVELLRDALTGAAMGFEASSFFVDEGNRPRIGQAFSSSIPTRSRAAIRLPRARRDADRGDAADEGVRLPGARRDALAAKAESAGIEVPHAAGRRRSCAAAGDDLMRPSGARAGREALRAAR